MTRHAFEILRVARSKRDGSVVNSQNRRVVIVLAMAAFSCAIRGGLGAQSAGLPGEPLRSTLTPLGPAGTVAEGDCSAAKLGTAIPPSTIGEPVSRVTLAPPRWVSATATMPLHCEVDGVMDAVDQSRTARPIDFRVALPAEWNHRAAQQGGSGNNGSIPDLSGSLYRINGQSLAELGFVTYGSDSGHQSGSGRRGGPPPGGVAAGGDTSEDWALNDEAMKNLGYMQMKKTHDAAMVIDRAGVRRASALQLLHRHVAGRPRSADRRRAVPGRLRRRDRERAHRELLFVDAGARTHPRCRNGRQPTG